ncbi:hypothetical protein ACTXT7_004649 [Hymenolepis weldensis]
MQNRPRAPFTPSRFNNPVNIRNLLDDSCLRFQIELEFVQSLGNPDYLTFLSQQGCFEKPEFINYLSYLQYWKSPQYSKFVSYPFCLHMLDLLQSPEFRRGIAHESLARYIDDQMLLHWRNYLHKRSEMVAKHAQAIDPLVGTPVPGSSG